MDLTTLVPLGLKASIVALKREKKPLIQRSSGKEIAYYVFHSWISTEANLLRGYQGMERRLRRHDEATAHSGGGSLRVVGFI